MRSKGMAYGLSLAALLALSPMAIAPAAAQDCVRTVRAISDFTITGDAWTWWTHAEGQYDRDRHPALGSVLVFKRTGRLHRGHVSLVSHIIDRRTIEVDHSWLDGRGLRRNMRVMDVSPNNDWSAVRVWHDPTDQMGLRVYATYGFILPDGERPQGRMLDANDSGIDTGFTVSPTGRGKARSGPGPRLLEASAAGSLTAKGAVTKAVAIGVPGRKPQTLTASFSPAPIKGMAAAKATTVAMAVLPSRKPTSPAGAALAVKGGEIASVEGTRILLPGRKPGSNTGSVAELSGE